MDSVVTAALGVVVFILGFGGDLRRLGGPLGTGDLVPGYAAAKLWSQGAPFGNNTLGYPFGIELRYFPSTDFCQNAAAGIITAISHNSFVGLNLVYALSFPVTALAALWVFRVVGVRGPIAIFTSLAFTAIPFHWLRLEHIYLATMYSAVLGVGLAILTGTGAVEKRLADKRRWPTIVRLAAVSLVVATSGIYYACFTILLCTAALLYRLAHRPSWRGALASTIPVASATVFTVASFMPAFVFQRNHPPLHPLADRLVIESVIYSGNLAFTLVPAPFTQLPVLKNLNPRIENAFAVASASGTSGVQWYADFGSLFTVLALALACAGLFWSAGRRTNEKDYPSHTSNLTKLGEPVSFGLVGLLLTTSALFFVPWGLNVVFAALVTPQIRAWDRLVPVLLLLFLMAGMVAWRSMSLPQKGTKALLIAAVFSTLLVFDSVVPYQASFATASSSAQYALRSGNEYAKELNAAIPGKCAILELPYQPFPEQPYLNALPSYDPLWVTLTNPDKEWTFGAMMGTLGSEWQRELGSDINASAISALVAGGFCGIHVDRRGFTALEDVQVAKRLSALLGRPIAAGHGGDWVAYALPAADPGQVFDILDAPKLPHEVARFFYPPAIAPHDGDVTVGAERSAFGPWWRATAQRTEFTIKSLDPAAKFSTVTGTLRAGDCAPRGVKIELHNGKEAVTTSFHLNPSEEHDFTLKLTGEVADAAMVVSAPGVLCTNAADQTVFTVALLAAHAR